MLSFRASVILLFFCAQSAFSQEQQSTGDCSPNIDATGNVTVECNFDTLRQPGLSFENFLRQVLVSEFTNSRRSTSNWALFAQNTGSTAYLQALRNDGVLSGVRWQEPLYLGGRQIQSASGLHDIDWYFGLYGTRGWFNAAEFSPLELSNGIIGEDINTALKADFASIGAKLKPLECETGLERFWSYELKVPGYRPAVFTHAESSGAALVSISFYLNLTDENALSQSHSSFPCEEFVFAN